VVRVVSTSASLINLGADRVLNALNECKYSRIALAESQNRQTHIWVIGWTPSFRYDIGNMEDGIGVLIGVSITWLNTPSPL
jgi:hypothetical protein